jgi:putative flavoprotein involved in K+ transport
MSHAGTISRPASTNGTEHAERSEQTQHTAHVETIVIGAGQAGLSLGYHLTRRGLPHLILEANDRVGDPWRRRWDSLRLFTPARFDSLPGLPFPAPGNTFPTKDEMAAYLEQYAAHFQLPVRTGAAVQELTRDGERFVVRTASATFTADQVVVAMSNYQRRRVPSFAHELDARTVQLHSSEYRNPSQLAPGGVLLVGAGNSGAELAVEARRHGHETWLSGRDTGHIPFRIDGRAGRLFLTRFMLRVMLHRVLSTSTPVGRKVRPAMTSHGGPLIRVKPADLSAAGVARVGRTVGARDGRPMLDDGHVLDVANIIWCTGFESGLSWIKLPIFGSDGAPQQERGVAPNEAGLFFVGRHFQYAVSSTMIHGVERDADFVARQIVARRTSLLTTARGLASVASA